MRKQNAILIILYYSNRKTPHNYDKHLYKESHFIEGLFKKCNILIYNNSLLCNLNVCLKYYKIFYCKLSYDEPEKIVHLHITNGIGV